MPQATDWRASNRARWDELVGVHLAPGGYDLASLRARHGRFDPIVEAELGDVSGLRVLHLQCHFGNDTLALAQRGAEVVGLDFSPAAVTAARALAAELGLADRARFVEADLYDARAVIPEPASFDRVFVTWGAINWLPDIDGWARIVAHFLKPGGALYLAEQHPAAMVFDDAARAPDGTPGLFAPYFAADPLVLDNQGDYVNLETELRNRVEIIWIHPLGAIVTALIDAGLTLEFLHEHPAIAWRMFGVLVEHGPDEYRWPDKPWLPLSFSIKARKP